MNTIFFPIFLEEGGGSDSIRMVRKTSGRSQEGSVSWAICAYLACFGRVFSQECLPNNWTGCSECGIGRVDLWSG